ncbi:MAG: hypothetical protein R3D55_03170 [Chloroflexota bacterium]
MWLIASGWGNSWWKIDEASAIFLVAATLTLLLAAFFRLWLLSDVPPGLAQDEVLDAGMPAYILAGNHAFFFRQGFGHEPLLPLLWHPVLPGAGRKCWRRGFRR